MNYYYQLEGKKELCDYIAIRAKTESEAIREMEAIVKGEHFHTNVKRLVLYQEDPIEELGMMIEIKSFDKLKHYTINKYLEKCYD